MSAAYPEAGSTYAYASRAIHPIAGYLSGWVMILDYILMPMLCVIVVGAASHKLLPAVPYGAWVILSALIITGINLRGIEMTSRAVNHLQYRIGLLCSMVPGRGSMGFDRTESAEERFFHLNRSTRLSGFPSNW